MMEPVIETQNLSKTYRSGFLMKEKMALSKLNLSVAQGSIFGFLGPNGAGKTTTIKLLTGLIHPTSGQGLIFGQNMNALSVKSRIGFLPERPYFYEYLTGLELLEFCGALFAMDKRALKKKIAVLLDLVQMTGSEKVQIRNYSKGMLQRIGLAQALLNDPELVILDEPMSGLDPVGRKVVRDIIRQLKAEGKTVFFSTHILSDAELICDEVAILVGGTLKKQGPLQSLLNPKVLSIEVALGAVPDDILVSLKALSTALSVHQDQVLLSVADSEALAKVLSICHETSLEVLHVVPRKESLEDIFMDQFRGALS